jgi:EmrB/QacA subfamily drug resistance transporter
MVSLDVTIVNVALPSIQHDLHISISGAQWTIDAYTLVLASLLLLSGSTADRIGRRRTFQLGLVVFSLGSLLCSVAPNLTWLIGCRMLQAVGGSMLNPVALSIIDNVFIDPKERARAIGAWAGVVGISMAAGPIVGGALVSSIGWRSIFWMNVPIALVALVLTARFVPESRASRPRRLDPVGQALIIGFLASLVYGIIEAPDLGWSSPAIIACFGASAAFLGILIYYEHRRRDPIIDMRFFRSAPFAGASLIAVLAFIGLGGFLFLNTLYLQDILGYSAIKAGLYLLPMALSMLVMGPVGGSVVARRGPRLPLLTGGALLCLAAAMFADAPTIIPGHSLLVGYILVGSGLGLLNAAITNTALSGMPRSQAGVAAATTSTSRQIGQSLGVAIIGSVLAAGAMAVRPGSAFTVDAHASWWILASAGALVVVVALITTGNWAKTTAERTHKLIEAGDAVVPKIAGA